MRILLIVATIFFTLNVSAATEDSYFQCLASLYKAERFYADADRFDSKPTDQVLHDTFAFDKNGKLTSIILPSVGAPGDTGPGVGEVKPVGLLTSRVEDGKTYLYTLTRDGFRKVLISDSDTKKNLVVGIRRWDEGDKNETFPNLKAVRVDSETLKQIPLKNVRASEDDQFNLLNHPENFKDDANNKFVAIDYAKTPLREGDKASAQKVFQKEFGKIIAAQVAAHNKQMIYLKNATEKEKENISFRLKGRDVKAYAKELTQGYTNALSKCEALDVGISSAAADAKSKIDQDFTSDFNPSVKPDAPIEKGNH